MVRSTINSGRADLRINCKTTVYLPEEPKKAVERDAQLRGSSESELIRQATAAAVVRPLPHAGLIEAKPFAEGAEQLLPGFGQR